MSENHETDVPPGSIGWMDRALNAIALICRILTGVALVFMTATFGWLVFGRYVLNATPTWVEQTSLLLVMVIAFLSAAVGVHENTHLSVNVIRSALPARLRMVLVVLSDLIMAGFGALMLWYGTKLTMFKWGSEIPLLHLPEGLRSLPLTIGGGLILLFSIGHLVRIALRRDTRSDIIQ